MSEEAKRYGRLTVLPTRMNPDLAMGDEPLKKTRARNLFLVFGEPATGGFAVKVINHYGDAMRKTRISGSPAG